MNRTAVPSVAGRRSFELPKDVVWLDTAHQGALPTKALAAARRALAWKSDPSRIPDEEFLATPDRLRRKLASLLECSPREIVVGNSASHGLHILAQGMDLAEGDEILLVEDDFPATILPWLPLRERGVQFRFLPQRRGLRAEAVERAIGSRTRLLSVTWVDSFSGHVLDLQRVGEVCSESDVLLVVNATQGVGVRRLRVGSLPVDAVTSAGYKWLCGPYGTGFCWISQELLVRLRSNRLYWLSAMGDGSVGQFDWAGWQHRTERSDARRHDVFCPASFLNVQPWIASLEYLLEVGDDALAAHNQRLVAAFRHTLQEIGCELSPDDTGEPPPFLVFDPPTNDTAEAFAERLRKAGIYIAVRKGRLRISPHIHNTMGDVDRFRMEIMGRQS